TENEKIKVRNVFITGAQRMDSAKLVGAMSNRKKGFLRSSNYNRDKYQEDLEKIVAEYHKHGFIDAYVKSDSIVIDTAANRLDIYIETYEGPRYYFGEPTFTDNDIFTDEQLRNISKFIPGAVFDQEKYDDVIFEIYTAYQEVGHLHVRVIDQRRFRDSIIDVEYVITEGLPSKVNMVSISGNVKTKDKVIRRELSVFPGQTFHRSLLMRSLRDVMALNYFGNVVPDVRNLPNGDVDIDINVEEKQTGQLNAGAGYSGRDRLVGTFGMGIPNLFGNGQTLNFNLQFGGRRNSSQISFTEPWMFGRPTLFGADVFTLNRQFEGIYTEGRRGASVRLGRRLRWPDNYFRVSTSYRIEGNRFFDFSNSYIDINSASFASETLTIDSTRIDTIVTTAVKNSERIYPVPQSLLDLGEDWNSASILSFTLRRDSRNLPEFASAGSQFRYTISKGGGFLGGYWSYTRHFGEFTKFFRLFGGVALAAKVQFGAVTSPQSDRRILETERFSPGGTSFVGVVRGYSDGSLTPDSLVRGNLVQDTVATTTVVINGTDTTISPVIDTTFQNAAGDDFSTRVRGKYLLTTNWEISVPLATNTLYFLTFFDAGNSWLKWDDIKPFSDVWPGAGVGFRLAVPGIGTIGFDFATPLKHPIVRSTGRPDSRNAGWRTHFQVGTVFR
ncbi:MAG: outer membrane protein assembly factor BamA, partial [Candidatus Zixiibacteriota bacterium]